MQNTDENGKDEFTTERFMKVYNNLPLKEREQTIVVIDDEPISWKMAKREIMQETDLGKKIAKKLTELDIL